MMDGDWSTAAEGDCTLECVVYYRRQGTPMLADP